MAWLAAGPAKRLFNLHRLCHTFKVVGAIRGARWQDPSQNTAQQPGAEIPARGRRDDRQCARVLRLPHLRLLFHPDRARLLPGPERLWQPDAVAGDVRGGLRHPANRRPGHRRLRRSRRPPAGDDAVLCHDRLLHRRHGADPDLRHHRHPGADPGGDRTHGSGLFAGRGDRLQYRLPRGGRADRPARPDLILARVSQNIALIARRRLVRNPADRLRAARPARSTPMAGGSPSCWAPWPCRLDCGSGPTCPKPCMRSR